MRCAPLARSGLCTALAGLLLLALPAPAADPPEPDAESRAAREVVEGFHAAMARGDRDAALALLLPSLQVFEEGVVESSREEYAAHHLAADMEFARGTRRELRARWDQVHGDVAWVTSRVALSGSFRGRRVARQLAETMVLRRTAEGWRIAHIHWSARPGA